MEEFVEFLLRNEYEHIKYRSESIQHAIDNQMKLLDAVDYILPRQTLQDVAKITDGQPYHIIFICEDGRAVIISMKTDIDCDRCEVIGKRTYGLIRVNEEKQREQKFRSKAEDWWKQYSEKLLSEIEATGGSQNVVLDKEYRLPCVEVKPYLDDLLRKETNDQFGLDHIDKNLNGLVVPLVIEIDTTPVEATQKQKTKAKSPKEKFAERQSKAKAV